MARSQRTSGLSALIVLLLLSPAAADDGEALWARILPAPGEMIVLTPEENGKFRVAGRLVAAQER